MIAMPLVKSVVSPPFAIHDRLRMPSTYWFARVVSPFEVMTSSDSGAIATLVVAAMACRRCAVSWVSFCRLATYTGVSTSARVASTADAVMNAIFQRNGNVEKRERRLTRDGSGAGVQPWRATRNGRRALLPVFTRESAQCNELHRVSFGGAGHILESVD